MDNITKLSDIIQTTLNKLGAEINDPRPVFVAGPEERLTINDKIDRVLANRISKEAMFKGLETYDESQDFDIKDPFELPEPGTEYTVLEEDIPPKKERQELPVEDETQDDGPAPAEIKDDEDPESTTAAPPW